MTTDTKWRGDSIGGDAIVRGGNRSCVELCHVGHQLVEFGGSLGWRWGVAGDSLCHQAIVSGEHDYPQTCLPEGFDVFG